VNAEYIDFSSILELYIDNRERIGSCDKYRFEKLKEDLGAIRLSDFANAFDRYMVIIKKSKNPKNDNKPYSASTINHYIKTVRAVFNTALANEIIEHNPINTRRYKLRDEVPRDRVLSKLEYTNLMNVIRQERPWIEAIVLFDMLIPTRKGELIRMKKEDLDIVNKVIRIRNGTTKNGQGLWKDIPPIMYEYFENLPKETDYLFYRYIKKHKKYVSVGDFKKSWKWVRDKAGIKNFHFHDGRRMSATDLINNGSPIHAVTEAGGWKNPYMLTTYYKCSGKGVGKLLNYG